MTEGGDLPSSSEVTVEGIGAGGVGVGSLPDGRVVFLPRTAPGDRVEVRLTREKPRWARGEVTSYLALGPGRREPPCTLYGECGGCSLQHLAYQEQLRWKGRICGDALRRIGGLEVDDPPVEGSPQELRYRNKLTLTLRRLGGDRVVAGFHEWRRPGRVLDVDGECLLPGEDLLEVWTVLRRSWGRDASRLPQGRELRLTLRAGHRGVALLVGGGWGTGDPQTLLEEIPGLVSVWREERDGAAVHLAGEEALGVIWLDEELELPGDAFLQVNRDAGEALHRFVLAGASEVRGLKVCDAYCGAGVLGRELARRGATVVGIEGDPSGVSAAMADAPPGFTAREGRVEDLLGGILPVDLLILNPPRSGLAETVAAELKEDVVERIIYVSCDPATLARDLARMGPAYRVVGVHCFDLFPQTDHVETVVELSGPNG